jgi:hypothetical protein
MRSLLPLGDLSPLGRRGNQVPNPPTSWFCLCHHDTSRRGSALCRHHPISLGDMVKPPKQKETVALVVQVRFEPGRLAADYLAAAYEHAAPLRRRSLSPPVSGTLVNQQSAQALEEGARAC